MTDDMTLKIAEEYVRRKCEWDCDMNKQCGSCMIRCVKQTIEMARKQQAEIERLKESYIAYEETTGLKQAKAEAVKEFAERLKDEFRILSLDATVLDYLVTSKVIDRVLKEMVGGAE